MDLVGLSKKVSLLVLFLAASSAYASRCPSMESDEFARYVATTGAKRLIFFASWCSSCREHLQSVGAGDVLVGVFDEADRIERLAAKLKTDAPCRQGDSIAKFYGVTSLPALRIIQPLQ